MRRLGLLERTPTGAEAVRVTAQFKLPLENRTRLALKEAIERRQHEIEETFTEFDALIVPDSLSVTGQLVEVLVPVANLTGLSEVLAHKGVRIDVIAPRNATF